MHFCPVCFEKSSFSLIQVLSFCATMMLQARGIAQVDFRNLSQYVGNEIKDFIHLLNW